MPWLCIEAHLLTGRYHGRGDDGRAAEWPPNPHRLFQALIAAANLGFRRTEMSDEKRESFRWLEARDPPEVIVPASRTGGMVRLYVPNNDMDAVVASDWKRSPAELRTAKDLRPRLLDRDSTVRFLWRLSDEEWPAARAYTDILCEEARHLHSLGLGMDLVAGNGRVLGDGERHALPGEVYVADSSIAGDWRAPARGSFDELVARHDELSMRVQAARGRGVVRSVAPPAPPTVRRDVTYLLRTEARSRPVHGFVFVDEDGDYKSFDPRKALHVAAWLRHAAHVEAKRLRLDPQFIEQFVCGHGVSVSEKENRFSYLPLPTISGFRDGRIRRALLVEPVGAPSAQALKVIRALGNSSLIDEEGEVKAELRGADPGREDGVFQQYLRPSRTWGSVTPVVLPGLDDKRSRKAIGLVTKALAQAGHTTRVAEISVQAEPVFPGAEMAGGYILPQHLKRWPCVHVILSFAEPSIGPVVVGGGRHSGLGVFAALD